MPPVNPGANPYAGAGAYAQLRLQAQRARGGSPFMPTGFSTGVPSSIGAYTMNQQMYAPRAAKPQAQSAMATPTTAWNNIATAFGRRQGGGQVVDPGAVDAGTSVVDPSQGMVMTYDQAGNPVYYGTPQAHAAALSGLARVLQGYGRGSGRYRQALAAAQGVLGPNASGEIAAYFNTHPSQQQRQAGY